MLPRSRRLRTEVFNQAITSGKLFQSPFFTLTAVKSTDSSPKESHFSAVAPKKFFKTAVERNKVRRRLYAAMDTDFLARVDANFNKFPFDCIVMAKPAMLDLKKPQITAALLDIFVKSGIIK